MKNKVNIIAVILAVAVFIGIIAYSQSRDGNESAGNDNEDVTGNSTSTTPTSTPSVPGSTGSGVGVAGATTASAPVSTGKSISAEILVENQVMAKMRPESAAQYPGQLTKLESAVSALATDPNDGTAWVVIGEVAEDFGKTDLAERAYIKSVEVEPAHGGWNHLGSIYLGRGEFFQAVWAYEGLAKYFPGLEADVRLLRAKALYFAQSGQAANAKSAYNLLIEKDPANKTEYETAIAAL